MVPTWGVRLRLQPRIGDCLKDFKVVKIWKCSPGVGALEYESDRYVPTKERKQGAFGVGFRRKQWGLWVWDLKRIGLFWFELPKIGGHLE